MLKIEIISPYEKFIPKRERSCWGFIPSIHLQSRTAFKKAPIFQPIIHFVFPAHTYTQKSAVSPCTHHASRRDILQPKKIQVES